MIQLFLRQADAIIMIVTTRNLAVLLAFLRNRTIFIPAELGGSLGRAAPRKRSVRRSHPETPSSAPTVTKTDDSFLKLFCEADFTDGDDAEVQAAGATITFDPVAELDKMQRALRRAEAELAAGFRWCRSLVRSGIFPNVLNRCSKHRPRRSAAVRRDSIYSTTPPPNSNSARRSSAGRTTAGTGASAEECHG